MKFSGIIVGTQIKYSSWWGYCALSAHDKSDLDRRHDAAPIMGTVEQFSQAWNSIAKCFVVSSPTYPEYFIDLPCSFRNVASKHASSE